MPIYEYECKKCKAHTEVMQKVTDKPLTKCRNCGGRLEKQLSAPAIQFKGSGWYITDYARKSEKPESKSGKSESKEEKSAAAETKAGGDKATSPEKDSSKKSSKPKPASSSGD